MHWISLSLGGIALTEDNVPELEYPDWQVGERTFGDDRRTLNRRRDDLLARVRRPVPPG
jgi:hypothetical protein